MRRQLREALGPEIKGLQRAVALEIADDARYDDAWRFDAAKGRRSKVRLVDLVRWTGAKNERVVRDALRSLSLAGWEFRLPIGTGADGRPLYAIPGLAMQYRVPDFAAPTAVGLSSEGAVVTGPSSEQGTVTAGPLSQEGPAVAAQGPVTTAEGPAVAAEGPAVAGPPSPVLLLASPQDSPSSSATRPPATTVTVVAVTEEEGGGDSFSEEITSKDTAARAFVDSLPMPGRQPGRKRQQEDRAQLTVRVAAAFAAGWSEAGLRRYLDLSDDPNVRSAAALYLHRLGADQLPDSEAPAVLEGTDAVVDGWMQLAGQMGDEREHATAGHRPSWGAPAYRGPARPNTVWDRIADDAANGRAPAGAERYKHCGTCDPVTRMRDGDGSAGEGKSNPCARCHPSMQFS